MTDTIICQVCRNKPATEVAIYGHYFNLYSLSEDNKPEEPLDGFNDREQTIYVCDDCDPDEAVEE